MDIPKEHWGSPHPAQRVALCSRPTLSLLWFSSASTPWRPGVEWLSLPHQSKGLGYLCVLQRSCSSQASLLMFLVCLEGGLTGVKLKA